MQDLEEIPPAVPYQVGDGEVDNQDLTRQFQGGKVARPSWLGQPFKARVAVLFKYWKDEAAEGRVTEALELLVPSPPLG